MRKIPSKNLIFAIFIPFLTLGVQWLLWRTLTPFVWLLFLPAVFLSARLAGLTGGLISTVLSAAMVWYFFIPPQLSWRIENPSNIYSVALFLIMGFFFSETHERLKAANQRTALALQETRITNEKLNQLYKKTLALDEIKTQFFTNVSHELRTPLTLILAPLAQSIADPGLGAQSRHNLEIVQRNALFLQRHVNDLLDIARLDAKQMTLHYAEIDLAYLARVSAAHFENLAADRPIRLLVDTPETLTAQVDHGKYERILFNLLSNAFKFAPVGGEIGLSLKVESEEAVLQVWDNGPGIPLELREVVFERFRQADETSAAKYGGTGLGLAIVKEFVTLHNGRVSVSDAPAGGAMFTIRLPLKAPSGAILPAIPDNIHTETKHQLVDELRREPGGLFALSQSNSSASLLILVVEDNPDMNDFICASLAKHYRVASAFDGQEGLEKALLLHPDLILADMMMPRMSGDEMIRAIRQHSGLTNLPIIILSAKDDEELRIKLLGEGVQDYLNKPFSLEELLIRVGSLLSGSRRAAEALRASEEHYRLLAENMSDTVILMDMNLHITYISPSVTRVRGFTLEELNALPLDRQMTPASVELATALISNLLERAYRPPCDEPIWVREELEFYKKDGSSYWNDASFVVIRGEDGEPIHILGTGHDINAQKQAETRLRRQAGILNTLLNSPADTVALLDPAGKVLDMNLNGAKRFGMSPTEIVGKNIYEILPEPVSSERKRIINEVMRTGQPAHFEDQRQETDFLNHIYPVNDSQSGELLGVAVFASDITESKQVAEALRSKDELLHLAGELAHVGGWEFDAKTLTGTWTDEVARIHDLDPNLPTNVELGVSFYTPESRQKIERAIQDAISFSQSYDLELEMVTASGNHKWVHSRGIPLTQDGKVVKVRGIFQDITESKQAEIVRRQSDELFSKAFQNSHAGLAISSFSDGRFININERYAAILGYTRGEIIGHTSLELKLLDEDQRQNIVQLLNQEGKLRNIELPMHSKTGSIVRTLYSIDLIDLNGEPHLLTSLIDITERKLAEEALRESEEKFKYIFDHSPIGKSITRVTGEFQANQAFYDMLGYAPEELQNGKWQEITHPEDIEATQKEVNALLSNEKDTMRMIKRYLHKNGSVVWADISTALRRDTQGNPLYLLTSVNDITERKHAEDALRSSEERYRGLFENMVEGYAYCKMIFENGKAQDWIYLAVNDAFTSLTGLKDVTGKKVSEAIPGILEADQELFNIYSRVSLTGKPEKFEMFVTALHMWFSISVYSPAREYFVAVFDVITERKQAEEALRASQARFSTVFHASPVSVSIVRQSDDRFLDVNEAWEKTTGFERDQVIGHTPLEIQLWVEPSERTRLITKQLMEGTVHDFEYLMRHKNGSMRNILISIEQIEVEGEPCMLTLAIDITERKRIETQLLEQLDELRSWHTVTLGRETHILDLKREVNDLLALTGSPPRYPSADVEQ